MGFPFQVAPRIAALIVDAHIEHTPTYGYQNGSDVILFDDLDTIGADKAVPISRNVYSIDAETGENSIHLQNPASLDLFRLEPKVMTDRLTPMREPGSDWGKRIGCLRTRGAAQISGSVGNSVKSREDLRGQNTTE